MALPPEQRPGIHGATPGASLNSFEIRERLPLHDKIALITGGTRDFGGSLTRELARQGATLIVGFRDKDPLTNRRSRETVEVLRELGATVAFVQGDITTEEGIQALAKAVDKVSADRTTEQGKVDFLILNAAAPSREVNVVANHKLLDTLLPHMGEGSVVAFIQSYQGQFEPLAQELGLIPDEYGIVATTKQEAEKSLRARIPEMAERNIRFATFVLPALPETSNAQIFARRDITAAEKNRQLTALLGLPETMTNDKAAKIVVNALARGVPQDYLDLLCPQVDARAVLRRIYGDKQIFVHTYNPETRTGYFVVTQAQADQRQEPPALTDYAITEEKDVIIAHLSILDVQVEGHVNGLVLAGHRQLRAVVDTLRIAAGAQDGILGGARLRGFEGVEFTGVVPPGKRLQIETIATGREGNIIKGDSTLTVDGKQVAVMKGVTVEITPPGKDQQELRGDQLAEAAAQTGGLELLSGDVLPLLGGFGPSEFVGEPLRPGDSITLTAGEPRRKKRTFSADVVVQRGDEIIARLTNIHGIIGNENLIRGIKERQERQN